MLNILSLVICSTLFISALVLRLNTPSASTIERVEVHLPEKITVGPSNCGKFEQSIVDRERAIHVRDLFYYRLRAKDAWAERELLKEDIEVETKRIKKLTDIVDAERDKLQCQNY